MNGTDNIVAAVCAEYGVSVEDVISSCRRQRVADARMMAIYLLFRRCDITKVEIGEYFNRTHQTVCYCVRRIKELLAFDRDTKRHYETIKEVLEE